MVDKREIIGYNVYKIGINKREECCEDESKRRKSHGCTHTHTQFID